MLCKSQLWKQGIKGFSPIRGDFLNTPVLAIKSGLLPLC